MARLLGFQRKVQRKMFENFKLGWMIRQSLNDNPEQWSVETSPSGAFIRSAYNSTTMMKLMYKNDDIIVQPVDIKLGVVDIFVKASVKSVNSTQLKRQEHKLIQDAIKFHGNEYPYKIILNNADRWVDVDEIAKNLLGESSTFIAFRDSDSNTTVHLATPDKECYMAAMLKHDPDSGNKYWTVD